MFAQRARRRLVSRRGEPGPLIRCTGRRGVAAGGGRIAPGCQAGGSTTSSDAGTLGNSASAATAARSVRPAPPTTPEGRPVPGDPRHPVDPRQVDPNALFGSADCYGNGKLWVGGLWKDGLIAAGPDFVDADGAVDMKFGWWRAVPDGSATAPSASSPWSSRSRDSRPVGTTASHQVST
jgi:hypothetical protein